MKIVDKRVHKIAFGDLQIGQTFQFDSSAKVFMKVARFNDSLNWPRAITLNNGTIKDIASDSLVNLVDCEIHLL